MKNVAVLGRLPCVALCFHPYPGGFDSSGVPAPGNLPSKANGGEGGRGWGQVELTDA